jgi:hypothetical protein
MKTPIVAIAALAGLLGSVAVTPASAQTWPGLAFPSFVNATKACALFNPSGACVSACTGQDKPRATVMIQNTAANWVYSPANICWKADLPVIRSISSLVPTCPNGLTLLGAKNTCVHPTDGKLNVQVTWVQKFACPTGYIANPANTQLCIPNPTTTTVAK